MDIKKTIFTILILISFEVCAQGGVGLPFLKIATGARQAGMGSVFTGVSDDVYAIHWNPGGLGHIRRWQWSAAYNKWFTDVYQATFSTVQQFRGLKSRKVSWGFTASYLGMPEWDATGGVAAPVRAESWVAGFSMGQRLDWLHPSISLGGTVKAVHSQMDMYTVTSPAFDAGLLIKPDRFKLGDAGFGVFDYGIVTLGASVLHVGPGMKFDQEITDLPMTWRAGASFLAGSYRTWSVLFASDWMQVLKRDGYASVACEVWWKEILGMRAGYQFNDRDLEGISFGLSFRWDDILLAAMGLPTRFGDAFEIDAADVPYGEVLQETYRGAMTHYSVAPEPFYLEEAKEMRSEVLDASQVLLTWETAIDPDPFDDVNYMLVIDRDPTRLQRAIQYFEKDMRGYLQSSVKDSAFLTLQTPETSYIFQPEEGGVYHWAVAAYDRSYHSRLAKKGKEKFSEFLVAVPDLLVKDIRFEYSPWITTTPEQGRLYIQIENQGTANADSFRLQITDTYLDDIKPAALVSTVDIPFLGLNSDTLLTVDWQTPYIGTHRITGFIDPDSAILEQEEMNNIYSENFISIPKGKIEASDSVEVMATGYDSTDVAVVPEVYFDLNSSLVKPFYVSEFHTIPTILLILADRLDRHPDVTLKIMGSIDKLSGETDVSLAARRAENVRNALLDLGVSAGQLQVVKNHPDKILSGRKRSDPDDARWVEEQNRVVTFSVPRPDEVKLFRPITVAVDTTLRDSVHFGLRIVSPARVLFWQVHGNPPPISNAIIEPAYGDSLWSDFSWNGTDEEKVLVPRNRWYTYFVALTDTMGREFQTRPDSIFLQEKRTIRRKEVFGAAKFAQVEPVYQFYWDRLDEIAREMAENPSMHVRFEGHACAIAADDINLRLSKRRAKRFTDAFLARLRKMYPDQYAFIKGRVEAPEGYGERQALTVKLKNAGEVILGNNESPVGRFWNRRISVLLYREN